MIKENLQEVERRTVKLDKRSGRDRSEVQLIRRQQNKTGVDDRRGLCGRNSQIWRKQAAGAA